MPPASLNVLGISGSLRKASYNTAALRELVAMAPEGMSIETFDLRPIPLYDEDVREKGYPPPVQEMREKVKAADALILVTPEYNYSVSGVLKNAIDWISRPPDQAINAKPIAILSASPGLFGGARAQYHLRQVLSALNGFVINRPEIMISNANTKFDESGKLTDEKTRELMGKLLASLKEWTLQLQRGRA